MPNPGTDELGSWLQAPRHLYRAFAGAFARVLDCSPEQDLKEAEGGCAVCSGRMGNCWSGDFGIAYLTPGLTGNWGRVEPKGENWGGIWSSPSCKRGRETGQSQAGWTLMDKATSQRGPKNGCFPTVALEKTLESPLNSKKIKQVNHKGNQP